MRECSLFYRKQKVCLTKSNKLAKSDSDIFQIQIKLKMSTISKLPFVVCHEKSTPYPTALEVDDP